MWFRRNGHREEPTLVLSGGGAMGALQVGVLRVLMRRGFRPGRIIGTSVGALNGAFLAFYPDLSGVERLAEIWRGLENDRYINFSPVRIAYRIALRQPYIFSNEFLQRLITEHTSIDDFSATKVPLHITAANMRTGRKHVFSSGPVSQAVLASTAIPAVFAPVEIEGETYIDGGVIANLDLETALELGAHDVLGIDLSHCFDNSAPSTVIGILTRTVDIVIRDRVDRDIELLSKQARIAVIQPEVEGGPGVGDLRQVSRLIEQGEAFGEQIYDRCFDGKGRLLPGIVSSEVAVPNTPNDDDPTSHDPSVHEDSPPPSAEGPASRRFASLVAQITRRKRRAPGEPYAASNSG
jgi:NTE family protein